MKLKYYLRGLGIGIVVTALIMGLSTGNTVQMTDAEIKAKAAMLGMVESDSLRLSDRGTATASPEATNSPEGTEAAETPGTTVSPEAEVTTTPEVTPTPEATATPEVTAMPEATATPAVTASPEATATPEVTATPEATASPAATAAPEATVPPEATASPKATVTIVVQKGDGSDTVSRRLAEAGVIEDASSFDRYLIEKGYSRKISIGAYEIEIGLSEEEVAKIITKTR